MSVSIVMLSPTQDTKQIKIVITIHSRNVKTSTDNPSVRQCEFLAITNIAVYFNPYIPIHSYSPIVHILITS